MKVELVDINDDWEVLLIDGESALEGHSIAVSQVLALLKERLDDFEFVHRSESRCIYCDKILADDNDLDEYKCVPPCGEV